MRRSTVESPASSERSNHGTRRDNGNTAFGVKARKQENQKHRDQVNGVPRHGIEDKDSGMTAEIQPEKANKPFERIRCPRRHLSAQRRRSVREKMKKEEIIVAAIHYEQQQLTSLALQQFATSLLDDGISTPSWLELAFMHDPIQSEMLNLLRIALQEINLEMPPESEWWSILTKHYILKVAESGNNARQALQDFMDKVYWPHICGFKDKTYVGDSHGLQSLIGLYWGYDDLTERPKEVSMAGKYGDEAILEWNKAVNQEAKAWLEKN